MSGQHTPIGQQFIETRERLSLSLDDIVSILRIKPQVLQIIEQDAYPSQEIDIFLKGYIVTYSRLLKIDPQTILNQLEAKGYNFPKDIMKEKRKERSQKSNYLWGIPVVVFLLFILMPKSQQEEKRAIAPYQGFAYENESME